MCVCGGVGGGGVGRRGGAGGVWGGVGGALQPRKLHRYIVFFVVFVSKRLFEIGHVVLKIDNNQVDMNS